MELRMDLVAAAQVKHRNIEMRVVRSTAEEGFSNQEPRQRRCNPFREVYLG